MKNGSSRFQVPGSKVNGNGVNRKGRQERKESSAFFSKSQPLPSFAFFASFAVQVFAVAVYSALHIPHSALPGPLQIPSPTPARRLEWRVVCRKTD
jgi:hypothetical protein